MRKKEDLKDRLIAIKIDQSEIYNFKSAFNFGPFIYGIVSSNNLIKIINKYEPHICPRKFRIPTSEDMNTSRTMFKVRTANKFETKWIYCMLKSIKENPYPEATSQIESLLNDNGEPTPYLSGEMSILDE